MFEKSDDPERQLRRPEKRTVGCGGAEFPSNDQFTTFVFGTGTSDPDKSGQAVSDNIAAVTDQPGAGSILGPGREC